METRCSKALLAEIFPLLPPYLQIKVVKRLFRFVSTGEMKFTAKSMYNFISHGEQLCLAVEILFSYLTLREDDNTANFNNTHMLKLIDGREDHSEWIGIREFLEQCHGRWSIERDNLSSCKEQLFNGFLFMDEKINKICLFISKRMVNINYDVQKYNNKFYATINELIALNFSPSDYSTILKSNSIEYYFKSECLRNLILLIKPFKIYYSKLSNIKFSCDNNQEDFFCECRLADSLNTAYELPFFWCSNRLCFRSAVRFHTDQEWEDYTVLDFMRILNIPIDYKNKMGKITPKGYFIIFSGMMKKFAKFYEHMKCRKCSHLLKPKGITNFAKQAITEFCCTNDTCENYNKLIYLNTCFNSKNCGEIIDSRDTLQCPNGQYICPNCGACCSNEIFEHRISNLKETGGYITQRLLSLANGKYGHWEKGEFYCYKCGGKMNTDVCQNCGSTYLKTK
jgi:hypothetical protein